MKKPNIRKEVWLVTTGLSKNEFEKELKKAKPGEQVAPLMHILSSTQDHLSQAAATLKIFCKE